MRPRVIIVRITQGGTDMKKTTRAVCLISSLLMVAGTAGATGKITAHANSALAYWRGTTATGAIVTDEQCPIEVEHERLTLNIPDLPQTSYSSQEEFEEYSASVTAEYTFYNPTELDVEMELVFPFGARPEYNFAGYNAETEQSSYFDDTARYTVTADGKEVAREVRHTYQRSGFDVESMYLILDEKKDDEFLKPDLPVTKYNFTLTFPNDKDSGIAEFKLRYDPARTVIVCPHYRAKEVKDGNLHLYLDADKENNAELSFTTVGEPPEILAAVLKEDGDWLIWASANWKEIKGGSVNEQPAVKMTFEQYVEEFRPEGIGEVDFYNGMTDFLAYYLTSPFYFPHGFLSEEPSQLGVHDFMRWYTYSLKIPAGERLINVVTAPLYPTINYKYCAYKYLLSPAKKWAKFGTLDIAVNTEFELDNSSLIFTKTESGYAVHSEGLPDSELSFWLSVKHEYPKNEGWGILLGSILGVMLLMAFGPPIAAGVTVGIVFGVRRAKKKKQNK